MKVVMLAVIRQGSNILGFRFMDIDAKSPKPFIDTYERTKLCLSKGTIPFANLALQNGEIKGVGGDISRYTSIDANGNKLGDDSWVILEQLNGGYKVCNFQGIIKQLKEQDIVDNLKLANGKIVNRDGKKTVSAISGEYEKALPTQEKPKTPKAVDKSIPKGVASPDAPQHQGNPEPIINEIDTPYLSESQKLYNMGITHIAANAVRLEDVKDEHSAYDCGVKLRRALFTLRDWSPLYFAILTKLDRIATRDIDTMAVSLNEFLINPEFLAHLTEPELMFILYHETFHIVLGHTFRRGDRDPEVWNIAADMIVNQYILNDMSTEHNKLVKGGTIVVPNAKATLIREITAQADGCYGKIDLSKDTAEAVYEELMANAQTMSKELTSDNLNQLGSDDFFGNGQSGSGNSSDGKDSSQNGQSSGSGSQSSSQSGKSGSSSKSSSSSNGSQSGSGTQSSSSSGGSSGSQSAQNQGTNSQQGGQSGDTGDGSQQGSQSGGGDEQKLGKVMKTTYNFRGDKITSRCSLDLNDLALNSNDGQSNANARRIAEAELKRMLTSASVAAQKTRGTMGTGALGDRIKIMLAPQVNWQVLLDRFLSVSTEALYTYARPDRRFLWKDEVLPGPMQERNKLKDLIIAIDTSGSISDEQISIAAGHIWNIYKKYKVNAYVVYWDTAVQRVEKLKRRGDILKMMPPRGGGTCVNSFLDWFKKHTAGGHKALDPCAVLVITDGYIESNEEIQEASKGLVRVRYGEKFIWLITDDDNYLNWKPPYGKKVRYLK